MWKVHAWAGDKSYEDLRYDRIRFAEASGGVANLTLYRDPGDHHADIGVGFRIESNWDEILAGLGLDPTNDASYINRIKALVNKKTL
jgi:hypothetical protein